jgi:hypothetical protein
MSCFIHFLLNFWSALIWTFKFKTSNARSSRNWKLKDVSNVILTFYLLSLPGREVILFVDLIWGHIAALGFKNVRLLCILDIWYFNFNNIRISKILNTIWIVSLLLYLHGGINLWIKYLYLKRKLYVKTCQ